MVVPAQLELLCRRLNGRVVEGVDSVFCVVDTPFVEEFLDDFVRVARQYRGDRMIGVVSRRLLGGVEEFTAIAYDPRSDSYEVVVRLAGVYRSPPPGSVVELPPRKLVLKAYGDVVIEVQGFTSVSDAGDMYDVRKPCTGCTVYGMALARAGPVPGTFPPEALRIVLDLAREKAAEVARDIIRHVRVLRW